MAVAGAGITRLGAFIADPLIEKGLLVPLFGRDSGSVITSGGHASFDFYACYLDRHAETPKIRAFIDHMVASLKGRWHV